MNDVVITIFIFTNDEELEEESIKRPKKLNRIFSKKHGEEAILKYLVPILLN